MIADPLWSCVMLLCEFAVLCICGLLWVFCGSFVVLCGPLRYLVIPLKFAYIVSVGLQHMTIEGCGHFR